MRQLLQLVDERLGLLLRVPDVGYTFRLRSLQEFFAGHALLDGDDDVVAKRIEAIAFDPHWSNVLRLIACKLAGDPKESRRAERCLLAFCGRLNSGASGREATVLRLGAKLAIELLENTESIALPKVKEALAIEAARLYDDCVGYASSLGASTPIQRQPGRGSERRQPRRGSERRQPGRGSELSSFITCVEGAAFSVAKQRTQ